MKSNKEDFQHLFDFLPHSYPFLMIDKVIKIKDKEIVALKNVSNNEPYFQGHFLGNPIMPGVLILEAMFQAGGLLNIHGAGSGFSTRTTYLTHITKAQFKKPVIPGDQLYVKVSILANIDSVCRFIGKADVNGIVVAEATWMSTASKLEGYFAS